MMAPAATAAATGAKAGAFDVATLFVADKDAAASAQASLAAAIKEKGVDFIASIGYVDATIKVSIRSIENLPSADETHNGDSVNDWRSGYAIFHCADFWFRQLCDSPWWHCLVAPLTIAGSPVQEGRRCPRGRRCLGFDPR